MVEMILEKKVKKCIECGELDMLTDAEELCSECQKKRAEKLKNALSI